MWVNHSMHWDITEACRTWQYIEVIWLPPSSTTETPMIGMIITLANGH
jgi:hypothetical protein